uniref:PRP1 splicing factor N-terminal domain-containing protein n=1 Tax=Oryza punctata TaxID=4537 RepID=A0A0E0JGQ7_ORYPU
MDSRRKDRREARLKQEIERYRASNPKITEQFSNLKRKLVDLSAQEWESIPEIGDYSLRNKKKKKRFESFVQVPDTLLEKAWQEQEHVTALDPKNRAAGGAETPWAQTPGYLTDLKSMKITSDAEISDIKKARLLLKSVTKTNPKHPPGWIAAARLEEVAGKLQIARQLIQRGCEECPTNEDVWLEACRLASPDEAKAVIAGASKLETSDLNKSRVLRKARLESYDQAKKVLSKAKEKLPKEPAIWIMAAKLEEANGNTESVNKVIKRSIKTLQREGLGIDREAWLKEAEAAERARSMMTCQAIVKNTIGIGVDDEDRKRTWVADAEECKKRGSIETARAIYAHALSVFVSKKSIWLKAAQLEKSQGTKESLYILLSKARTCNQHAEVLWLMSAKETWLAGDVPAARDILQEASASLPDSEEIWLAAFKLEFENNEPERARILLSKARGRGGTERVWMKSAIVERELGNVDEERKLLEEGLKLFPSFFKLWLMLGQMEDWLGHGAKAKEAYENALKHCPSCIPLWLSLANLEEKINGLSKLRAVLTMARKKNPATPELWLAAVRAELRHGNKKEADALLAKGITGVPNKWCFVGCSYRDGATSPTKVNRARSWLNRAVTLAPDIGDFWALYYKSKLQHGNADAQKDVLQRCVAAEPKHGERWQAITKAVENSHLSIERLLKKALVALGQDENPNSADP